MIRIWSRIIGTFFFCTRSEALLDIPKIHPVKDQVDDEQGRECQAPVIVHVQPLVPEKTKIYRMTATPAHTRWQEEEQYQPWDKRRYERYQASDIDQGIDGDASHEKHLWFSGVVSNNKGIGSVWRGRIITETTRSQPFGSRSQTYITPIPARVVMMQSGKPAVWKCPASRSFSAH